MIRFRMHIHMSRPEEKPLPGTKVETVCGRTKRAARENDRALFGCYECLSLHLVISDANVLAVNDAIERLVGIADMLNRDGDATVRPVTPREAARILDQRKTEELTNERMALMTIFMSWLDGMVRR